ncbi:MAG: hypothetical protein ACJA1B_000745 [Polaribacter sp.]|jgi:hypothetical protein
MKKIKNSLITSAEEIMFNSLLNFDLAQKNKKHSYLNKKGKKFKIK